MYLILKEENISKGKVNGQFASQVLTKEQVQILKEVLLNEINALERFAEKRPYNEEFIEDRCQKIDEIYDILK